MLIFLVLTTPHPAGRKMDERITLRQKDKIPYGTYAAYQMLPPLFPGATTSIDKLSPLDWLYALEKDTGQAMILTAVTFEPDESELVEINRFIEKGNYVFIIANSLSYEAAQHFGSSGSGAVFYLQPGDSLTVQLSHPPYKQQTSFLYPGKKWDSYFSQTDKYLSRTMGTDATGHPNFIQLQSGKGKLFVHLAPLAFSNYFLLHKKNVEYFQKVVSVIPPTVTNVVWNEYFLTRRKKNESEPGMLNVLWLYPSFRWALLTAIITLALYTIIESQRRRSYIPAFVKPANDSLDFVRTLGRLYYDQKDHTNLARKMAAVFLDAVRNRYHLSTQNLDADFVAELHNKSGYDAAQLRTIVAFIEYVQADNGINEEQLAHFHQQLETYYQNT